MAGRAKNLIDHVAETARGKVRVARARRSADTETDQATAYWRDLEGYHSSNDDDPRAIERSRWIADTLIPELGITSLLEIGTNSGRNLRIAKQTHPDLRVCGLDVNERALEHARRQAPDVEFRLQDANRWEEAPGSWDAILTMSVLDHIPDDATEELAARIAATARYVIAVELWDGDAGERGAFKYGRDNKELFERHGARTLKWEMSPGQYDLEQSPLWAYVGEFPGRD